MKPYSRIIQLSPYTNPSGVFEYFVAICEDGSLWRFYPDRQRRFELMDEMENGRYV